MSLLMVVLLLSMRACSLEDAEDDRPLQYDGVEYRTHTTAASTRLALRVHLTTLDYFYALRWTDL